MVDLRVWILTYPASTWDVGVLKSDCLAAFAGQNLSVEVRVVSNSHRGEDALPAFRYIGAAMAAQWQVGNARLAKRLSVLTLMWHVRQLVGLSASLVRLISNQHRVKVSAESVRAARIAAGHAQMWREASRDVSGLYLFLEDDVTLTNPKMFVEVTRSLLEMKKTDSLFVCDVSHSYSLHDLGIDSRSSRPQGSADSQIVVFDFPFTNTLAATFMSHDLFERVLYKSLSADGLKGLGVDLDLSRLMAQITPNPTGCLSKQAVFRQKSEFKSQRI